MSRKLLLCFVLMSMLAKQSALVDGNDEEGDIAEETPGPARRTSNVSTDPNDVSFYLYWNKDKPELKDLIVYGDLESVRKANFVKGKPVIFITHGFLNSVESENSPVPRIKGAYLKTGVVNIIGVDWERLAGPNPPQAFPGSLFSYVEVMQRGIPTAGRRLCAMIYFLVKAGIISGPEKVHLIGYSLGAHVSGVAGHCVQQKSNGSHLVDRITGLDPAGPLFAFARKAAKLDRKDATFVDVVHTDKGRLGTTERTGTVDFYANGGKGVLQPNCLNFTLDRLVAGSIFTDNLFGSCPHGRAIDYFARSILRTKPDLVGCRCDATAELLLPTACISPISICKDPTLFGQFVPRSARG